MMPGQRVERKKAWEAWVLEQVDRVGSEGDERCVSRDHKNNLSGGKGEQEGDSSEEEVSTPARDTDDSASVATKKRKEGG